jgi:hypothetical protein
MQCKIFKANLFTPNDKLKLEVYVIVIRNSKFKEPIILITTLDINPNNLQNIVSLYKKRWLIETTIEMLKQNFGLEKIMVRSWKGIGMLIKIILICYTLLVLLLSTLSPEILDYMIKILKKITILKKNNITIGKLRYFIEIIESNYSRKKFLFSYIQQV